MALLKAPGVRPLVRAAFELMARMDNDMAIDRDVVLRMFEGLRDPTGRRAFVRTLRAAVDLRGQVVTMLDRCYLTVGMPTLLVWGARDAVIPVEHGYIAHAAMPGSRLEVFEGAGHFPHHFAPERFLAVLNDFLENTAPNHFDAQQWRTLLRAGREGLQAKMPRPSPKLVEPLSATHTA